MKDQIASYLHHLEHNRKVSPDTLKNYRSTLNRFETWLDGEEFSESAVMDFMSENYDHAASANVVRARLIGFAKYHDANTSKIVRQKEPKKSIDALDSSQVELVVAAAYAISGQLAAIVIFLRETGLRWSEFMRYKPEHIETHYSTSAEGVKTFHTIEVWGKGQKLRTVPLSDIAYEVVPRLPSYLTAYAQQEIRKEMTQAGRDAGIRMKVHPHMLRATFISILLNEQGVDSAIVAKLVGHSSPDTLLKHYFRESKETLYNAVNGGRKVPERKESPRQTTELSNGRPRLQLVRSQSGLVANGAVERADESGGSDDVRFVPKLRLIRAV
jgi:integrase/recombinase XerC